MWLVGVGPSTLILGVLTPTEPTDGNAHVSLSPRSLSVSNYIDTAGWGTAAMRVTDEDDDKWEQRK